MVLTPRAQDLVAEASERILLEHPTGLRHAELLAALRDELPQQKLNTLRGSIQKISQRDDAPWTKSSYGFYRHKSITAEQADQAVTDEIINKNLCEADYYEPLAQWLVDNLVECDKATVLGGSALRQKWGTPDVVGVKRCGIRDVIKFEMEIVTAEVKLEPRELITAFGQAVAYRLFSNRVYIAVPTEAAEDDKARLEALCMLFGIGLVLFPLDANMDDIDFQLRVRAARHEVDFSFQNEFLNTLDSKRPDVFKNLFG